MKWLFMIFRLRALQRLYRKHEEKAELFNAAMIEFNDEGEVIYAAIACKEWETEKAHMAKLESLIKLLQ